MVSEKRASGGVVDATHLRIGGFLFSILWEAQCRYVFPYYVFLILYAPMGLYAVGRMIGGLWNLHKGNRIRNQADTDEELREIA